MGSFKQLLVESTAAASDIFKTASRD